MRCDWGSGKVPEVPVAYSSRLIAIAVSVRCWRLERRVALSLCGAAPSDVEDKLEGMIAVAVMDDADEAALRELEEAAPGASGAVVVRMGLARFLVCTRVAVVVCVLDSGCGRCNPCRSL
jgi:hypothetical protein